MPYEFHSKNTDFEPHLEDPISNLIWKMKRYISKKSLLRKVHLGITISEVYSIEVADDASTIIQVVTSQGGLYALNTLSQLFYTHSESSSCIYTPYSNPH